MEKWVIDYLQSDLAEVHCDFNNIISEMQENGVDYPYEKYISIENSDYEVAHEAIQKMEELYRQYHVLVSENDEFFSGEFNIIAKYLMLYVFSIIIIRVFSKTLSSEKINEIWYGLLGLFLGTVNTGLINKRIKEYRYGNKNRRLFMDEFYSSKEEFEEYFEIVRKRVNNIHLQNRELEKEIVKHVYIKK